MELGIALYVRDALIRPYGGDFLVVILLYAGLRLFFFRVSSLRLAVVSFAVGALVELCQLFHLFARLGVGRYPVLQIAVGTTFQWGDLVAYGLGVIAVWAIDERTALLR